MDETRVEQTFGLKERDLNYLKISIARIPEIEQAIIFGSRAMGNNKLASDVDICLKGDRVSRDSCLNLKVRLEEYPIPFFFDIVCYKDITNVKLKLHIDNFGVLLYSR